MRFGMWNVMNLYRSVTLTAAARELARYKLDLVGVQEVRWDKRGQCKSRDYNFLYGRGKKISNWEWDICTQQNGTSSKRLEFVIYRVSYIMPKGR